MRKHTAKVLFQLINVEIRQGSWYILFCKHIIAVRRFANTIFSSLHHFLCNRKCVLYTAHIFSTKIFYFPEEYVLYILVVTSRLPILLQGTSQWKIVMCQKHTIHREKISFHVYLLGNWPFIHILQLVHFRKPLFLYSLNWLWTKMRTTYYCE